MRPQLHPQRTANCPSSGSSRWPQAVAHVSPQLYPDEFEPLRWSLMTTFGSHSSQWSAEWQQSWDLLEQGLVPDREWLISGLVDVVEAVVGSQPVVIDLGCGTGTVALRLFDRLPAASVIAFDVDPVLLTIASATFSHDHRVQVVTADLRDPDWAGALPQSTVDAVITATALHWLPEASVRRLYGDLAGLIRTGGVFAHAEFMAMVDLPTIGKAMAGLRQGQATAQHGNRGPSWDEWWERAAADPELTNAFASRSEVFEATYTLEEFSPPADWHTRALVEAGFKEAGVVFRAGHSAVVAAVR